MDYKKEYYKIKGKYIELSKEVEENIPKKINKINNLDYNINKYTEKTENVNLTRSKIPQVCLDTSNILEFKKDNLHIFKKNIVEAIKKGIRHFLVSSEYANKLEGLYLQSVGNGINDGIKQVNRKGSKISREDIFITMKGNNASSISIDLDQSRLKYFDLWVFDKPSSLSDDNRKSLELAIYESKVKDWGINQATSESVIKLAHELKIGDKNCMANILQILPENQTIDGKNSFGTTIKTCFDFGIVPFLFGIIDGINSELRPDLKLQLKLKPLHQMYDDILKYYLVTYLYDKTSVFIIGDEKGLTRERILQLLEDEERNKFEMTEERLNQVQNYIWYQGIKHL